MEPTIGIDLGTTFSVMAHVDSEGQRRTIPNSEGDLLTPSAVFFDRDQPIVGREAIKAGLFEPERLCQFAKRDVGKREIRDPILGQALPPEVIQALILKKLRDDASLMLGDFHKVVVTVPAYFNEPRRKSTQDAGRLAGLEVLDIINEPTAAAIAYGVQQGFLDEAGGASDKELILVYDLGGGTFDATLMEIEGCNYRAIATAGDVYLGGIDWDSRIVDHLAKEFRLQYGLDPRNDDAAQLELRREAEEAKRSLSTRSSVSVHVAFKDRRLKVDLTRELLGELTDDLTSRTLFTIEKMLREANRTWGDVTRVLLAGGSSRMPLVQQALEKASGHAVDRSLSPDEAVAHGAAIYADLLVSRQSDERPKIAVVNVNSHDLGVLGMEKSTGMQRRKVLIPRNSPLPADGGARFKTRHANQPDVSIEVIEGGDASGNNSTPIGKCIVKDLPPDLPAGTPITVRFRYESDGRLAVKAALAGVKGGASMVVDRAAGLSEDEIDQWRERVKFNQVLDESAEEGLASSHQIDQLLEADALAALDELGEDPDDAGTTVKPIAAVGVDPDAETVAAELPTGIPEAAPAEPVGEVPDFGVEETAADQVEEMPEFLLGEDDSEPEKPAADDDNLRDFLSGLG